jgi:hypothetical protein
LAGEAGGDVGTVIRPDHVQAEVYARGAAGRGQDVAVVQIENRRVDHDEWIAPSQFAALGPMRRDPSPVEQPGRGQHERTGTQRDHARAPPVGATQGLHDVVRYLTTGAEGRHDDRVGAAQLIQTMADLQVQTVLGGHRRRGGADGEVVPVDAQIIDRFGVAEDLAGDAELEQRESVADESGHPVRTSAEVGRFGTHPDNNATHDRTRSDRR